MAVLLRRLSLLALAVLLVAAACGGDDDGEAASTTTDSASAASATAAPEGEEPYAGYESEVYADGQNWLCRPDQEDICDIGLDATEVAEDGTLTVIEPAPADAPPVDCFYVYPTISGDPGNVADLEPGPSEEGNAALNQAARFSSACRVFAPVYRQITLNGIMGSATQAERDGAYADVLDAWKTYVSQDNEGRGVVLIGHSQGSGHLQRLIAEEIDGVPALRDRLVSAVLLGSSVAVPDGEVVGGVFQEVPLCTEAGEVGCVLTYATFRATAPPGPDSYFGVVDGPERAGCTNPAALGGGAAELTPYFPAEGTNPFAPGTPAPEITTPWVTYPGLLSGECARHGEADVLELTIAADPSGPRIDDIGGDLTPPWGLHLVDANIAMGDLVDRVGEQIEAYVG
jgi:hypothetical protein